MLSEVPRTILFSIKITHVLISATQCEVRRQTVLSIFKFLLTWNIEQAKEDCIFLEV